MAKQSLYTIGYTSFVHNSEVDIERMMLTLRQLQVNYLVDVRSSPYSGQFPQTNCDILKGAGKAFGIPYVHMGELGAQAKVEQAVFSEHQKSFLNKMLFLSQKAIALSTLSYNPLRKLWTLTSLGTTITL